MEKLSKGLRIFSLVAAIIIAIFFYNLFISMSNPILDNTDKKIKWQCKEIDMSFEQYPSNNGDGYEFTDCYVTIDDQEYRLVFNLYNEAESGYIYIDWRQLRPNKSDREDHVEEQQSISGEYKNNSIFRKEFVVKIGKNDTIFKDYKKLTFVGTEI